MILSNPHILRPVGLFALGLGLILLGLDESASAGQRGRQHGGNGPRVQRAPTLNSARQLAVTRNTIPSRLQFTSSAHQSFRNLTPSNSNVKKLKTLTGSIPAGLAASGLTLPTRPETAPIGGLRNAGSNWKTLQRQIGNPTIGQVASLCRTVRRTPSLHWHFGKWCNFFPARCHWWYNWCGPTYYFDPTCCATYHWYYYPCRIVSEGTVQSFSWHLGLNCVFIPGRGLGVQEVEAGSPAELAGFQPGMILLTANGEDLATEGAMQRVIERSNGTLVITTLAKADTDPVTVTVTMARVAEVGY